MLNMNRTRRDFVGTALVTTASLAGLSGCTGDSTDDAADVAGTADAGSRNESGTTVGDVDFPEGVSEDGIEDFEALEERTVEVFANQGGRLKLETTREDPSYTSLRREILIDPTAEELLVDKKEVDGSGNRTGFYRIYVSLSREEAVSHHMEAGMEESPSEEPEVLERDFGTLVQDLYSEVIAPRMELVSQFEYELSEGGEDQPGVIAFEAVEATDELTLKESEIDGSNYELNEGEITLRTDGELLTGHLRLENDDVGYEMTLETEFGETDVPRPEWVDEATSELPLPTLN